MITTEPRIRVGLMEGQREVQGGPVGTFDVNGERVSGSLSATMADHTIIVRIGGREITTAEMRAQGSEGCSFGIWNVTIGLQFHWERKEDQTFHGDLRLVPDERGMTIINEIGVEEYLKSVISSEMSAESPPELLKAHAITSRSWLVAMLERQKKSRATSARHGWQKNDEVVRWYDREDHALYDVCADDHCQRYQGTAKIVPAAAAAVESTRGVFLVYEDEICDARFSKSCGGRTELFGTAWEEQSVSYLRSVADAEEEFPGDLGDERSAEKWILESPPVYCNTSEGRILKQILPSFDQETTDFFRWKVAYDQETITALVRTKSGIEFGEILDLVPIQRGPSGRILRLRIVGSKRTMVVGKELEIRKWLSPSHLYSSAFVARADRGPDGIPERWTLAGAGWGHGVGLCQIGAAVMALKGKKAEEIVQHYFREAELKKLY